MVGIMYGRWTAWTKVVWARDLGVLEQYTLMHYLAATSKIKHVKDAPFYVCKDTCIARQTLLLIILNLIDKLCRYF